MGAVLLALYSTGAAVYVPHLFSSYATRYGVIGAVFAMISALFCVMVVVVASAALGREVGDELARIRSGERPRDDEVRRGMGRMHRRDALELGGPARADRSSPPPQDRIGAPRMNQGHEPPAQRVEVLVSGRTLLVLLGFGVLVALAILSLGTLLSIFLAAVLALGLDPVVGALVRRGWKRGRASLLVFAVLFVARLRARRARRRAGVGRRSSSSSTRCRATGTS